MKAQHAHHEDACMPFFDHSRPLRAHVQLCTEAQTQTVHLLETFVWSHPPELPWTGAAMLFSCLGVDLSSLALAISTSQHAPSTP